MTHTAATPVPMSVAEASTALEAARAAHLRAKANLETATTEVQWLRAAEIAAYKAFNDAVAALRTPRKPRKPRKAKEAEQ